MYSQNSMIISENTAKTSDIYIYTRKTYFQQTRQKATNQTNIVFKNTVADIL